MTPFSGLFVRNLPAFGCLSYVWTPVTPYPVEDMFWNYRTRRSSSVLRTRTSQGQCPGELVLELKGLFHSAWVMLGYTDAPGLTGTMDVTNTSYALRWRHTAMTLVNKARARAPLSGERHPTHGKKQGRCLRLWMSRFTGTLFPTTPRSCRLTCFPVRGGACLHASSTHSQLQPDRKNEPQHSGTFKFQIPRTYIASAPQLFPFLLGQSCHSNPHRSNWSRNTGAAGSLHPQYKRE